MTFEFEEENIAIGSVGVNGYNHATYVVISRHESFQHTACCLVTFKDMRLFEKQYHVYAGEILSEKQRKKKQ